MLSMRWTVLKKQHEKIAELNHRVQRQRGRQTPRRRSQRHLKAQDKRQEATLISTATHQLPDPKAVVRSSSLKSGAHKDHRRWLRAQRWHNLLTVSTAPNKDPERRRGLSLPALGLLAVRPAGLGSEASHSLSPLQLLREMGEWWATLEEGLRFSIIRSERWDSTIRMHFLKIHILSMSQR